MGEHKALEILKLVVASAKEALTAVGATNLVNVPDGVANAIGMLQRGLEIVARIEAGSTDYDTLTPEEIETLLWPRSKEALQEDVRQTS
jgi:hypothetical protein